MILNSNAHLLSAAPFKQSGSTLLVSLVLLTAITILGLSSMRGALVNEKAARNVQDNRLAMDAAESALKIGQRIIKNDSLSDSHPAFHDSRSLSSTRQSAVPSLSDWETNYRQVTSDELNQSASGFSILGPVPLPKIKIELFYSDGERQIDAINAPEIKLPLENSAYRVYARSTGLDNKTNEVILENTVILGSNNL